jgi:RimJ/RimL family protein N-acetyltransferase
MHVMSDADNQVKLPGWVFSASDGGVGSIKLPVPSKESINPLEHPHTINCELCWFASDKEDNLIGVVGLSNIDQKSRHAELNISGESSQSELIKLSIQKMCDHCLDTLNLNRVHIRVRSKNPLCDILLEIGFVHEATKRNHLFVGGNYHDVSWFGFNRADREEGKI